VHDVAAFDQYLSGVELAAEVDLATVAELLQQRSWEPSELLRELGRMFSLRGGRRLRFAGRLAAGLPVEVIEWCAEQCVKHGAPLPKGLARAEIAAIGGALRPEWVSAAAVSRLEKLGLDQAGTDRVAGWLLDGHVPLPESGRADSPIVAAVFETVHPSPPLTPRDLAAASARLYAVHESMWRVARERWLERLDAAAGAPLGGVPSLTEVLKAAAATQWLLIDCLGLPLVEALEPVVFEALAEWKSEPARFAEVSAPTTTDACYRDLLDVGGARLEKIDVVDELIHGDFLPFPDLLSVCATRLRTACKARRERLDPSAPLVVFADHGFRIARNGRGYVHGGASTLERLVPVWHLRPR
jgi:hypothetical protein